VIEPTISAWLKQTVVDRIDAEGILCFVLNKSRSYLYSHNEDVLSDKVLAQANAMEKRRAQGEPLAYLVGQCEFWSLTFVVNQHVLIPRNDTECLVEYALSQWSKLPQEGVVIDAGAGSGAIAIAVASETQTPVVAIERSDAALPITVLNAQRLAPGLVNCLQGNWLTAIASGSVRMLLSNPPYIAQHDPHLNAAELRCEPQQALVAGNDGLDDLRLLAFEAARVLVSGGIVVLEHGFEQGAQVRSLLRSAGLIDASTEQDLNANDRITHARQP